MEEMTREEYMEMCGDCLSEEECVQLFERTKQELKDGTAVWNMSLEVAYNEFVTGLEEAICEDVERELFPERQNMPCDTSGICDGHGCSQYYQCQC